MPKVYTPKITYHDVTEQSHLHPMSKILDLSEGMRIGIPFRAQSTIDIDEERFSEYDYEFPPDSGITLIETGDDISPLQGYYGTAIAEVSSLNDSQAGYLFISLTIVQVDIDGKLSISREEGSQGNGYSSNLDRHGDDIAGPTSTVEKLDRGF